jgi:predicted SAM-dependent methyltransferase
MFRSDMLNVKINLGCGAVFVDDGEWVNLDFAPVSPAVQQANLLERLPFADNTAVVVYSSHFLEHIPRAAVTCVLTQLFRVLKPGGRVRLVLPDLENLCSEYLAHRSNDENDKANFIVLEMIDQCVRSRSGGELGRFYQQVKLAGEAKSVDMVAFVRDRTGEDLSAAADRTQGVSGGAMRRRIGAVLLRLWIWLVLQLLPATFRAQNVSQAQVGERHHWLWDFHQLRSALQEAGFVDICRQDAANSTIGDFPFYPLDLDAQGRSRKGAESMYVEARKPSGYHENSDS